MNLGASEDDERRIEVLAQVETDFGHPYPTDFGPTDFGQTNLGKPILANVKVLVECKEFGFWEFIIWVFFDIHCSGFFVCVELSWVVVLTKCRVGVGGRRGLSREVGTPMVGWGGGWRFGGLFFFPFCFSLGGLLVEFWWCLKRRGLKYARLDVPAVETHFGQTDFGQS